MRGTIAPCSILLLVYIIGAAQCQSSEYGEFLGSFTNYAHDIAGDVYAVDNKRLFIKGFTYDGTGPDAYFWGGTSDKPDSKGVKILNERNSIEVLQPYRNRDITITLPDGLTLDNLRWISVWCKRFGANFGDLILPTRRSSVVAAPAPKPAAPAVQEESAVQAVGPLVTFDHGVSGDVVIFDDQTIVINKFKYDGRGPGAFFWADYGDKLTSQGQLLGSSLTINAGDPLPRANGNQMVIVNIPHGRTVHDYKVFGIWCDEAAVSFGEVLLPSSSTAAQPAQTRPDTKKKENKLNCEVLHDDSAYEVRWALTDDNIVMQLVGKIEEGNYMAFGLSGDEQSSLMAGGDVTVAWIDENGSGHAEDYFLKSKESCTNNRGSCPDTTFGKENNVEMLNSALVNGFHMVTVKRPLFKQDDDEDENIYIDGPQAIIWAIGKMNNDDLVTYHFKKRNKNTIMIDFARTPKWNCPQPSEQSESSEPARKPNVPVQRRKSTTKEPVVPWDIPKFTCPRRRRFRARIGPSGGRKGYEAITGEVGWGIAWYLNGILLPEITLQRGRTYTFEVEGGNDPKNAAKSHPFYITSSSAGGHAASTEEEKENEIIYAGAEFNERTGEYEATASGRLCEYELKGDKRAEDYDTFAEYKDDLRVKCKRGRPSVLSWKPDSSTPDTVYYQCFTHKHLGYKINIVDSCDNLRGAASILSVRNVSKAQNVEEKVVEAVKVPDPLVYNSKPAQLPQLPRPIVRPRPTKASDKNGDPKPIVVEEVVENTKSKSKPPKRTIYVPVKIVPEDELPKNIPIHDGSDKQFVFGNPIAVPLGARPNNNNNNNNNKPSSSSNKFSFQGGFKPLILRDQSSITEPLKNQFHNTPTHLVGSESIGQSFKAPKPESGFKVVNSAKQSGQQNGKNKVKYVNKKKPGALNLNLPSFEPQKVKQKVKPQQPRPQYQEKQPRPQYQGQPKPQFQEGQPRPQFQEGQPRPQFQEGQPRPQFQEGQPRPQFQEGQPRPQFQEEQSRPQHQEGQPRPQYQEEQTRPQHQQGQSQSHNQGSQLQNQAQPQFQNSQPRPQNQGQPRPQHQERPRPQHQERPRPQHQEHPRPQHQEHQRPQHQGDQVRPQSHFDEHRPQPHFDQRRPEHHEGQRRPPFNGRPRPHHQEGRPRPHPQEGQRRPGFHEEGPHSHGRPQLHHGPADDHRRPQLPHQDHQRPPFKNGPSQSHVGQPQANYEQVFNSPQRKPARGSQVNDRPFRVVAQSAQVSSYRPPIKPEVIRNPVFPQNFQQQRHASGRRPNTENRPPTVTGQQGQKNSSEYAVLTHVMEYISQGQQPNFSHKVNKREAGSAEPEPKSEPEPKKEDGDKMMDDKGKSESSKDKNDAMSTSISFSAVAAVILAALFV